MADAIHITGDHKDFVPYAGQRHRGFTPGMACANYDTGIVRHSSDFCFFVEEMISPTPP
jgi:hypothetical protein